MDKLIAEADMKTPPPDTKLPRGTIKEQLESTGSSLELGDGISSSG